MNKNLIDVIPIVEWQKLINSIINKVAKKSDTEDLAQEAWIAIYKASEKFNENNGVKFTTYASTCIYRRLAKLIYNERNCPNIENDLLVEDLKEDNSKILTRLSEYLKEEPLLREYFIEGKTYEQISKETGKCPSMTYKAVKRALQRIKVKINEDN